MNGIERILNQGNVIDEARRRREEVALLKRRNVVVGTLDEMSDELGEMIAGADAEGEELAVNGDFSAGDSTGWGDSTGISSWSGYALSGGAYSLASDRYGVEPGALVKAGIDVAQSGSTPQVEWYDALSGGSLVGVDDLVRGSEAVQIGSVNGYRYARQMRAPGNAAAMRLVVSGAISGARFDNVSMREMAYATRFGLDPFPRLSHEGAAMRLSGGLYQLDPPPAPVVTASPLGVGTRIHYVLTLVDAQGGETTPGRSRLIITNGTRTIRLPAPQCSHTAVRIYRVIKPLMDTSIPDLAEYDLLAEVPAGTYSYSDSAGTLADAPPPVENTTASRPILPVAARQLGNSMRASSALDWNAASSQIHGEYWRTPDAVGEWVAPDPVLLETGRYVFTWLGVRSTSGGIGTVYMDGHVIGTVDQYNGSTSYNHQPTINFVVEEPGLHEFVVVVESSSGSGYRLYVTEYWVRRVGR